MLRIAAYFAVAVIWLSPGVAPSAEGSPTGPLELDSAGEAAYTYVLTRQLTVDLVAGAVIPFSYPERPTLDCWIGGQHRPLLFNTGTHTCILWQNEQWPDLPALHETDCSAVIAQLEGKPQTNAAGQRLNYARAILLDAGEVSLYNVPFRIYSGGTEPGADFAGAIAPIALRRYLIEVNNTAGEIKLHERAGWTPPPGTCVLPLLSLPRGIFLPLWLGHEAGDGGSGHPAEMYWFHLDTGFSGTIGVVPAVRQAHPQWFAASSAPAQDFQGWHEQYSYVPQLIHRVELRPLSTPGCPSTAPLAFTEVEGLVYREAYAELEGYRIGGIIGSGFLQQFNYVLDYELSRCYFLP